MSTETDPQKAAAAEQRAAAVEALQTERAYLTRQPKPNTRRIAEVEAELDRYSDKPAKRGRRETAAKG